MAKKTLSKGKLAAIVLGLATYVGVSSYAVLAVFTDSTTVPNNQFSTGTIDLTATPTPATLTLANMAPGDTMAGGITVNNAGSLALRYAVSSLTTENFLAPQLELSVRLEASLAACTKTSTGMPLFYDKGDLGSTAGINIVGDPTQGQQANDRVLNAGASEVLCFQVHLPLATDNTFQNKTTTATFTFQAEQVANNP